MLEEVIWLNNFETLNTTFDLQHGISHNMFQEDVPSIQQRKGNSGPVTTGSTDCITSGRTLLSLEQPTETR